MQQIFAIVGVIRKPAASVEEEPVEIAVPLVYALLADKTQASYAAVLRAVRDFAETAGIENVTPPTCMMDFEFAVKNAVEEVFPHSAVRYCFFHLGQSVYRRVQAEGLQEKYNDADDRSVKEGTHMLLALAFVPVSDLRPAFTGLYDELPDDLLPVADYFEEMYLFGRRGRGRRAAVLPRYPPAFWNTYESILHFHHRANNLSEGWHNKFQQAVGKHHPSLYSALQEFLREQADTESIITALDLGQAVKAKPKKKWRIMMDRMRRVVASYEIYKDDNDTLSYLRHLGHNIAL